MNERELIEIDESDLFARVVNILEHARANVARSVNTNMVVAYWMIGREIVEELQDGEQRAEYGKQVIEELSKRLNEKYGKGFSVTSLKYFRTFYQVYYNRFDIRRPTGDQFNYPEKGRKRGDLLDVNQKNHPIDDKLENEKAPHLVGNSEDEVISLPTGRELQKSFNPNLSWSHYRALMRVKNCEARNFYEKEAAECGWSKTQLERQIHSSYYERIIANQGKEDNAKGQTSAIDFYIKHAILAVK